MIQLSFRGKPLVEEREWPTLTDGIQVSEENAEKLKRFLQKPGNQSRYLEEAFLDLPEMDWRLWEPALAQEFVAGELEQTTALPCEPSIDSIQALLIWLSGTSPLTEKNLALLALLGDPTRFAIPVFTDLYLAQGWVRFGDPKIARLWLEEARKEVYKIDQANLEKFNLTGLAENKSFPPGALALDGKIEGRVFLQGVPPDQGVRAGLFSVFGAAPADLSQNGADYLPSLSHLVDAQWVRPDGSFQFDHLSKGKYCLAFLIPDGLVPPGNGLNWQATRHPGIMVLSDKKTEMRLGTIELRPKNPLE